MIISPATSYKKATQALNFVASKKGGTVNKMKAIKLIFLADRLHLRKYGRPIVGDMYWAMKLGPVGSLTKNIAELEGAPASVLAYAKKYIKPIDEKKHHFASQKPVDMDVFSKTDIECLEAVYEKFSDKDQFELKDITHQYPEWIKHKKDLLAGKKRVKMDYDDFFNDALKGDDFFAQNKLDLSLAKESFEENKEIAAFFAK